MAQERRTTPLELSPFYAAKIKLLHTFSPELSAVFLFLHVASHHHHTNGKEVRGNVSFENASILTLLCLPRPRPAPRVESAEASRCPVPCRWMGRGTSPVSPAPAKPARGRPDRRCLPPTPDLTRHLPSPPKWAKWDRAIRLASLPGPQPRAQLRLGRFPCRAGLFCRPAAHSPFMAASAKHILRSPGRSGPEEPPSAAAAAASAPRPGQPAQQRQRRQREEPARQPRPAPASALALPRPSRAAATAAASM